MIERPDKVNSISVAIPTYEREEVLVATIKSLLEQRHASEEIIVLDQTPEHKASTEDALERLSREGWIQWIRWSKPSIPKVMNHALKASKAEWVLFLDDDVVPYEKLLTVYRTMELEEAIWAVAGQVLQPGEEPKELTSTYNRTGLNAYLDFPFYSSVRTEINNCMAGNVLIRRDRALKIGGFDENYIGSAFRFETDFCRRVDKAGGKIVFEPAASIRHLRAESGGTRSMGSHLCSASPLHGMGDYYYAFRHGSVKEIFVYCVKRMIKEVINRHNLKHPWCLAVKTIGEVRSLFLGYQYYCQGPKMLITQ